MSLKDKLISIDPNCTWKELGGQVIILQANCTPPMTHELNGTGSYIWSLLGSEPKSFSVLLKATSETYEANTNDLESDLIELIDKLEDLSLIRLSN
jgi:hypothetical protein